MKYLDPALLLVTILVTMLAYTLYFFIHYGVLINVVFLLLWSLVAIVKLLVDMYFWATVISVLVSWISAFSMHPLADLSKQLVAPPTGYMGRWIPGFAGLDFSPMFFILGLSLIDNLVVGTLAMGFHTPILFSLGL